jgi:multiple sugar transport system permease protein
MKGKGQDMRKEQNSFLKAVPFLLPSLLGLIIFNIIPIFTSLLISFTNWNGLSNLSEVFEQFGKEYYIGLSNYKEILASSEFWRVLGNTAYFIILYLPLILITSMAAGAILNSKIKGISFFRVLYYIPVLTSWVAGALIWKWVLSPEYGAINEILRIFNIEGPKWLQSETWAMPSIVLASIWKDVGYFGLIFLGGLQGINPAYYEASEIDGANWWQKFTKITLPLLSPVTFFVIIISIINSFQLFPQVMVMTKDAGPNGATQVFVERIYKYAFQYNKMGFASAYSWILFIIIFIFTNIQMKLQDRWVYYEI